MQKIIETLENRIKCGKCGTEFDLNKNKDGCPLCGFGRTVIKEPEKHEVRAEQRQDTNLKEMILIPPDLILKPGSVITDDETKVWGSWLMFNDFFAPKFMSRIAAWMHKEKTEPILLNHLMSNTINLIRKYDFSEYKGFPNLEKDAKGTRLVHHFLKTFANMGLVDVESNSSNNTDVWKDNWENMKVSLTREGLVFAQFKNNIFDEGNKEQILTKEEREWLIGYLKHIDKQGYKEYSVLKEVYEFLKSGKNGNKDLWNWFETNQKFKDYIRNRSEKAKNDESIFKKQLQNYSRSFTSAKISLLRELGVVKDKRNDYTIIGDL